MSEQFISTWDKRFKARHYSYRDNHSVSTVVMSENNMLLLVAAGLASTPSVTSSNVYYVFGTNAQLVTNPTTAAWAAYGASLWPSNCFGRELLLNCDEDAYIKIVSLNPQYLKEVTLQAFNKVVPSAPQLLFESEELLQAGNLYRLFPTYGYALCYRASTDVGTLIIKIEANIEGDE